MLDEVYGEVSICGMFYQSSRALKELDPTAYRCGMSDWADGEEKDRWESYRELEEALEEAQEALDAITE